MRRVLWCVLAVGLVALAATVGRSWGGAGLTGRAAATAGAAEPAPSAEPAPTQPAPTRHPSPAPSVAAVLTPPAAAAPVAAVAPAAGRPFQPSAPATRSLSALAVAAHLGDEGGAQQLIVVEAATLGDTFAQLQAFDRVDGRWVPALAPTTARLGRSGLSTHHMEGDGTTPAGTFTMTEAFGNLPNPGTRLPYRQVQVNDEWVSDSTSPYYNTWQVGPANGRWSSSEKLWTLTTAYAHAVVIDYNRSPVVPYRGDGIFLHVKNDDPTSGCVAIAADDLVAIMRWLDPARSPKIAIGTDDLLLG